MSHVITGYGSKMDMNFLLWKNCLIFRMLESTKRLKCAVFHKKKKDLRLKINKD